jgi:hypothetical protein
VGIASAYWNLDCKAISRWVLSELGKDSAGQFKKILREAYSKLRNSPIRAYDHSDFEKMQSGANPMSVGHALPVIGIGLQIEDVVKRRWGMRCILPAELSEEQIQKALEQMQSYLPSIVELERKYLADLKENQIVPGSRSYIYELQQGWISANEMLL